MEEHRRHCKSLATLLCIAMCIPKASASHDGSASNFRLLVLHRRSMRSRAVGRSSLKNLADPGVRRLLNRVKQLEAFDGHIKIWADGLSFANVFSHPHVQLHNIERKPCRDRGWNPVIALGYREFRQRFARLRTAHSELGDLYVSRLARACTHNGFDVFSKLLVIWKVDHRGLRAK